MRQALSTRVRVGGVKLDILVDLDATHKIIDENTWAYLSHEHHRYVEGQSDRETNLHIRLYPPSPSKRNLDLWHASRTRNCAGRNHCYHRERNISAGKQQPWSWECFGYQTYISLDIYPGVKPVAHPLSRMPFNLRQGDMHVAGTQNITDLLSRLIYDN